MNTKGSSSQEYSTIYDCVIVGGGAAGLFYAGLGEPKDGQKLLILEKTSRPGQKLLISGSGMCNITHGGSIKDFVGKYGDKGRLIRKTLYSHNNIELISKLESAGIKTIAREDGKIFPASLRSADVLDMLLNNARDAGWTLKCNSEVTQIEIQRPSSSIIQLTVKNTSKSDRPIQSIRTKKLVIACGGSSYPSTGSDGSFFSVMERDLGIRIAAPRPALAPVYVQDYSYQDISGISFDNVRLSCKSNDGKQRITEGPMLLTHKGFSGPAMLHISQYVSPGTIICVNYLADDNIESLKERFRSGRKGNTLSAVNYITHVTCLPKAFVQQVIKDMDIRAKKAADLSNSDIDKLIRLFTEHPYSVSGTGGFDDAMVTAGGVCLEQIDLKTMQIKNSILSSDKNAVSDRSIAADIRVIGEALDVNGDTGGYNLQFAYSSAMAAHSLR